MTAAEREISTASDDADGSAEDFTAGKLLPSDVPDGSRDFGSDRDDESEIGRCPTAEGLLNGRRLIRGIVR
jgi:hypothetical protein